MEATVIPPARITFAVQQETAKQTHHKPPKAHKTRHQAPAWSKAAEKRMPVANNLYNETSTQVTVVTTEKSKQSSNFADSTTVAI